MSLGKAGGVQNYEWLLFLPQLPANPSTLRVAVWRRLRSAGALSLQSGAWVLPRSPEHEHFLAEQAREVASQGGSALVFVAYPLEPEVQVSILERFRAERDRDYGEFLERSEDFLAEIEKETKRRKFTFAELEENDLDLKKLEGWLSRIQARDFFGGHKVHEAVAALERCRQALKEFARKVYESEGLGPEGGTAP